MERSLNFVWPRAASGIYVEPRSLEDHGLVDAAEVPESKRIRARYSITHRGRQALLAWIRRPSAPTVFESEAALKLAFADVATRADALRLIDELEADARARTDQLLKIFDPYADGRGPYPDRAHVVGVTSRLYYDHYAAMIEWARWARAEVEQWPAADGTIAYRGQPIIAESRRLFGDNGPQPDEEDDGVVPG